MVVAVFSKWKCGLNGSCGIVTCCNILIPGSPFLFHSIPPMLSSRGASDEGSALVFICVIRAICGFGLEGLFDSDF